MTIHFLLTPDKSSSLTLKRHVAEQLGCMDVIVGTWPELLTQAKNSHILPLSKDNWQEKLVATATEIPGAFWEDSRKIAPAETDAIVGQHLAILLEGLGPDRTLASIADGHLPERLGRRVKDFISLHEKMAGILPSDLATISSIISVGQERRLRPLRVYHLADWPRLNPWQQRLLDHLNSLAGPEDVRLRRILEASVTTPSAPSQSPLRFIQKQLFSLPGSRVPRNPESIQWLSVRDYLQEIEVCAGMIQLALNEHNGGLRPENIAILIPDDEQYAATTHSVFISAGLPLSDPGDDNKVRDLAAETLLNLLISLNKPAPLLAVASLVTSPLMPWSTATGNLFAQRIMDGTFNPDRFTEVDGKEKELLGHFLKGMSSSKQLAWFLTAFLPERLNREKKLEQHTKRAIQLCTELTASLPPTGEVPWKTLIESISPIPLSGDVKRPVYRNGIAVFREGDEPWRKVKRLYVLGCSEGHYPSAPQLSQVFTDADLVSLQAAGVAVETMSERSLHRREIFKRQLGSTAEHSTFLVPRRDPAGKALAPSASLTFAARLLFAFDMESRPFDLDEETLSFELETGDGRSQAHGLPIVEKMSPVALTPGVEVLELGSDLLRDSNGVYRTESPSRLETLMVSPLAWLFDRFDIKPREWQPESLDIKAKGTLAHAVFEHLFKPGGEIPTAVEIEAESGVKRLLADAIHEKMIFLENDEWKVERAHLEQDIIKAALAWGEILRKIGADIVAAEVPLRGTFDELPIHGNADLLLELPGNRLLVVDYKKSGSTGRRTRMNEGFDSQAELYRTMLKSGGLDETKKRKNLPEGLKEKLALYRNAGEIGTLYYLMSDRTALADTNDWIARSIAGTEEIKADASKAAMSLIRRRIRELSDGIIDLRLMEPEKELKEKRGLGTYGLDSSPLVRMFLKEPLSKEAVE